MATIKEIAELAGVSRGTVDRVLNNRGDVNSETAEALNILHYFIKCKTLLCCIFGERETMFEKTTERIVSY